MTSRWTGVWLWAVGAVVIIVGLYLPDWLLPILWVAGFLISVAGGALWGAASARKEE